MRLGDEAPPSVVSEGNWPHSSTGVENSEVFPSLEGGTLLHTFVGVLLSFFVVSVAIFLHVFLPGRSVVGYACSDDPRKHDILVYKLNGVVAMVVTLIALLLCVHIVHAHVIKLDDEDESNDFEALTMLGTAVESLAIVENYRFGLFCGSQVLVLFAASYFYHRGLQWSQRHGSHPSERSIRTMSKDQVWRSLSFVRSHGENSPFGDFLNGIGEFNPRSEALEEVVDWKLCLCMCRTIMTQILVLSAAAIQIVHEKQRWTSAIMVTTGLWTWVCLDILLNEAAFLYTYDIVAERMGLRLIWKAIGFSPFVQTISAYQLLHISDYGQADISSKSISLITLIFLIGWALTRGASHQKYMFKTQPRQRKILFGLVKQRAIHSKKATDVPRQLLTSGFWGLAKHVNYFGDILRAAALALPALLILDSSSPIFMLQLLLILLHPVWVIWRSVRRQMQDDALCRVRYGDDAWDEYSSIVRYRIVPYIY